MLYRDEDDILLSVFFCLHTVLTVLVGLLMAVFLVSAWLTRLLLQLLLPRWRPQDRTGDALIVVISSALWSVVFGLGMYLYLLTTDLVQLTPAHWTVSLVSGAVWGALVAMRILIIANQPPPSPFTEVLGLPSELYESPDK